MSSPGGHDGPTILLAFATFHAYHLANIIDINDAGDIHITGLGIDFNFHEMCLPAESETHPDIGATLDMPGVLEDWRGEAQRIIDAFLAGPNWFSDY